MFNFCTCSFFLASNQNQKEEGKRPCDNCDAEFSQLLQNNHKAITDAIFDKINEERNQLKTKTDRIEVLTDRVSLFIAEQDEIRTSLQNCLKNCEELERENAKLMETLNSCAE